MSFFYALVFFKLPGLPPLTQRTFDFWELLLESSELHYSEIADAGTLKFRIRTLLNFNFLLSVASDSDSSGDDDDAEPENPVLLRRKRFIPRKDRAVKDLDSARNPANFDPVPPVTTHVRYVTGSPGL